MPPVRTYRTKQKILGEDRYCDTELKELHCSRREGFDLQKPLTSVSRGVFAWISISRSRRGYFAYISNANRQSDSRKYCTFDRVSCNRALLFFYLVLSSPSLSLWEASVCNRILMRRFPRASVCIPLGSSPTARFASSLRLPRSQTTKSPDKRLDRRPFPLRVEWLPTTCRGIDNKMYEIWEFAVWSRLSWMFCAFVRNLKVREWPKHFV